MAKWKVEEYRSSFRVVRDGGCAVAYFDVSAFPDAEQRAEKLCEELNERDAPKWKVGKTDYLRDEILYDGGIVGYLDREYSEHFVAMMNADESK